MEEGYGSFDGILGDLGHFLTDVKDGNTYCRLIQPELKTKGSLFNWGTSPFRFQGRTSFQNKMASQMFDQPTNVVRSPGSERHMRSLERGEDTN